MAAVYKSLNKQPNGKVNSDEAEPKSKNRQRVLILTSRGVTYRYGLSILDGRILY